MAFGLTADGYVIKRLEDIKSEIQEVARETFGDAINLREDELLGQLIGIVAEREALVWEYNQELYDMLSPSTASGVALDNIVEITGIQRLAATKGTGTVTLYGTLGTVVSAGFIVSVDGLPESRFVTTADATLAAGTNEIQDIDFTAVPTASAWTLIFDGEETGSLAFNDVAATVQTTLNALSNLSAVTVAGNYTDGFTVTFAGADGSIDQPLLQIGTNTLTNTGIQVNVSFAETTPGELPNVDVAVQAETAGNIPAYAGTLTVIETPISGVDSVTNATDITAGTDTETDAELRLRRNETLSTAGAATVEAIRSRILEIDAVTSCRVFENDAMTASGDRPAKSFEAVVLGGVDADIAETIWDVKPAGIASYGTTTESVTDSMGFAHDVKFSRPDEIEIYMIVNITTDDDFPAGGETSLKQALVDYADANQGIGNDVITVRYYTPTNEILGIVDAEILVGTAPAPTLDTNISIADDEIAVFDTTRITINVT